VSDAVELAEKGLPTIVVLTERFIDIAEYVREHLGHPRLELLVLPHPLEHQSEEYLRQVTRDSYPRVLAMLGATVV
jgi:hypothetical protein